MSVHRVIGHVAQPQIPAASMVVDVLVRRPQPGMWRGVVADHEPEQNYMGEWMVRVRGNPRGGQHWSEWVTVSRIRIVPAIDLLGDLVRD